MNFKNLLLLILLAPFLIFSCKNDDPIPQVTVKSGILTFNFSHSSDTSTLVQNGTTFYTNAAGNSFNVSTLKYFISNITLVKNDGSSIDYKIYKLIDAFDASSQDLALMEVPNGDYKAIKFYLGIDSTLNHSGTQDGDLGSGTGMLWSWASGYLFLKAEGFYKKGTSNVPYRFHIGTDAFLNKITNNVSFTVNGDNKTVFMHCNIAELFKNPNVYDISTGDDIQSFPNQTATTAKLSANMADMVSIVKVE